MTESLMMVFGPIETLSPRVIDPSKITFTSIEQSLPAVITPLTSSLELSEMVIP